MPKVARASIQDKIQVGKETDIVIPIMGATGAGKSSFINFLLGEDRMKVGHQLSSCTPKVETVVIDPSNRFPGLKNHRIIIVDTPGFDDACVSNVEILRGFTNWLTASYRKRMVLGGVIYLHDISQDRLSNTARQNLEAFNRFCGTATLEKVVLATTKWSRVSESDGSRREAELREVHWKPIVEKGSQVRRFLGNQESAWDILAVFIQREITQMKVPEEVFSRSDIVVLVTGVTGSGRSKFINNFLGYNRMKVGDSGSTLNCTTHIEYAVHVPTMTPGQRVVIVDTPGFDDTYQFDSEILQQIANWLHARFPNGVGCGGVIYLHDISADRYQGVSRVELGLLNRSFGGSPQVHQRVVLVTTKWNRLSQGSGENREKELLEKHWKSLIDGGTMHHRCNEDDDVKPIVNGLISTLNNAVDLDFEREIDELRKSRQVESDKSKREENFIRWSIAVLRDLFVQKRK